MSDSKRYRAYDYLIAGEDYEEFDLAPERDRVPPYEFGLNESERTRVEDLVARSLLISLHDHPVVFPANMADAPAYNRTGRQRTAYEGLAASKMTAIFDNMMDGTGCVTAKAPWKFDDIVIDLGMRQADLAHQDEVICATSLGSIYEAKRTGKVALVFGLEAATPIENELDRLDVLFGLGLRQIGIAYSDGNSLGSGLAEPNDGGLTNLGRRALHRMAQLGLAVDVSHSSDRTALDVCAAAEAPILMTHAGARSVWPTSRMKPDDVLRAIADTGGVIGMSAAPHTTLSHAHPSHTIDSVMDHFEYIADMVGIDHVAFGPDTLYGDHVGMHTVYAKMLRISSIGGDLEYPRVPYVAGLENPTENFVNLTCWLVQHGYSDEEITKVLGGNIVRALRAIWHFESEATGPEQGAQQ
ncbi:MAG: dipeptidase [Acidimicrobiales bacterium]